MTMLQERPPYVGVNVPTRVRLSNPLGLSVAKHFDSFYKRYYGSTYHSFECEGSWVSFTYDINWIRLAKPMYRDLSDLHETCCHELERLNYNWGTADYEQITPFVDKGDYNCIWEAYKEFYIERVARLGEAPPIPELICFCHPECDAESRDEFIESNIIGYGDEIISDVLQATTYDEYAGNYNIYITAQREDWEKAWAPYDVDDDLNLEVTILNLRNGGGYELTATVSGTDYTGPGPRDQPHIHIFSRIIPLTDHRPLKPQFIELMKLVGIDTDHINMTDLNDDTYNPEEDN